MTTDRVITHPDNCALSPNDAIFSHQFPRTPSFNDYQQKTSATLATDMPAPVYQPEYEGRDHRND